MAVARLADLRVVDSRLDDFLDIVSEIMVGSLTAIFLSPWVGVPVGVAANYGLKKSGFATKVVSTATFMLRKGRLKDVAAGRIETEWQGGG